jgi:hypothetical protein
MGRQKAGVAMIRFKKSLSVLLTLALFFTNIPPAYAAEDIRCIGMTEGQYTSDFFQYFHYFVEENSTLTFPVGPNHPSPSAASIRIRTTDDPSAVAPAIAGQDYTPIDQRIDIPAGSANPTFVSIPIHSIAPETEKTFLLEMYNVTGPFSPGPSVVVHIVSAAGSSNFYFTQSVYYTTEGQPAQAYVKSSGNITAQCDTRNIDYSSFVDQSAKTFYIPPSPATLEFFTTDNSDVANNPWESFEIELVRPVGANVGMPSKATIVVFDNEQVNLGTTHTITASAGVNPWSGSCSRRK